MANRFVPIVSDRSAICMRDHLVLKHHEKPYQWYNSDANRL
jgi:hypothetical protein